MINYHTTYTPWHLKQGWSATFSRRVADFVYMYIPKEARR